MAYIKQGRMDCPIALEKMNPKKPDELEVLEDVFKNTKCWQSLQVVAKKLERNADKKIKKLMNDEVKAIEI